MAAVASVMLSVTGAKAQEPSSPSQAVIESAWGSKALLVERRTLAGSWAPWTILPLAVSSARQASPRGGPEFAVWHQGDRRRVEIWCAKESMAWERLSAGASAQLEFDCLGGRYRAQVGLFAGADASPQEAQAPNMDQIQQGDQK